MGLFFQRKNGREDGAINRVGIRGKDEVRGGGVGNKTGQPIFIVQMIIWVSYVLNRTVVDGD